MGGAKQDRQGHGPRGLREASGGLQKWRGQRYTAGAARAQPVLGEEVSACADGFMGCRGTEANVLAGHVSRWAAIWPDLAIRPRCRGSELQVAIRGASDLRRRFCVGVRSVLRRVGQKK